MEMRLDRGGLVCVYGWVADERGEARVIICGYSGGISADIGAMAPAAARELASMLQAAAFEAEGIKICGRINGGCVCSMPAGGSCPDCGPACHSVPEGA